MFRDLGCVPVAVSGRPERCRDLAHLGFDFAGTLEAARERGARAVVVATDTRCHVADAEYALGLGVHVLCEKPLASHAADGRSLPELAGSRGLGLFVGYCLRFDVGLLAFRERLASLGPLHSVRIECRSYLPDWRADRDYRESYSAREEEGGVLRDLSHEIDLALWLFGTPGEVQGDLVNTGRLGIASEELAEGSWRAGEGVSVSVGLDYLSRSPVRFVRASGERGELAFELVSGDLRQSMAGEPQTVEHVDRSRNAVYEAQARAFVRWLEGGSPGPLATAAEALEVLEVCDAWRRSARSRTAERVAG